MSGLEPNEKLSKRLQVGFTDHGPSVLPITRPSPEHDFKTRSAGTVGKPIRLRKPRAYKTFSYPKKWEMAAVVTAPQLMSIYITFIKYLVGIYSDE